jgi:hypothetical protein
MICHSRLTTYLLLLLMGFLCSGYTRKEPFANNFAGLNWTPQ